jgi:hypothetical protein
MCGVGKKTDLKARGLLSERKDVIMFQDSPLLHFGAGYSDDYPHLPCSRSVPQLNSAPVVTCKAGQVDAPLSSALQAISIVRRLNIGLPKRPWDRRRPARTSCSERESVRKTTLGVSPKH